MLAPLAHAQPADLLVQLLQLLLLVLLPLRTLPPLLVGDGGVDLLGLLEVVQHVVD